jgi:predicted Zn-ribbon and HTH transcriptional regulator
MDTMNARKALLWTTLICLGLAAVGAVASVLMGTWNVSWRIVGSTALAAVACGVGYRFSLRTEKPETRASGLVGLGVVAGAFLLFLLGIWDVGAGWLSNGNETLPGSGLAVVVTGLTAAFFVQLTTKPVSRTAGLAGVGGQVAALIILLVPIWIPMNYGSGPGSSSSWTVMGASVYLFWLPLTACLVNYPERRLRWLRLAGAGLAGAGCAMACCRAWFRLDEPEFAFVLVTGLAVLAANANLLNVCPLKPTQGWMRWAAFAVSGVAMVLVDVAAHRPGSSSGFNAYSSNTEDLASRLAAAAAIVAVCANMGVVVVMLINRKQAGDGPQVLTELREMSAVCPACGRQQILTIGPSQCPDCGLKITVQIEEPRCPVCGYVLLRLTTDRCPECGTPIVRLPGKKTEAATGTQEAVATTEAPVHTA